MHAGGGGGVGGSQCRLHPHRKASFLGFSPRVAAPGSCRCLRMKNSQSQSQFRGSPLALVLDEQGGLWKTRYGMFEDANLQRQGLKPVWVRFKAPPDLAASTRSCQLCTSCKLPLRTPCIGSFSARAGRCLPLRTPYTDSFADCAGRCSPFRTPCIGSFSAHGGRCLLLHMPCTGTFSDCTHTSPTAPLVLAFPLRFSSASSMASLAAEAPPAHPCSTLVHSPLALAAAANCRHLLARPNHPVTPHLPRPPRCRRRVPCTATPHPLSVQLPPQHISPLLSDQ